MLALNRNVQTALWQNNLPATPSFGTTLTAHATPHSKGAWATLMTTTYDVYGFWIFIQNTFAVSTQTDMMLDIAFGPNKENIVVSEWLIGWRTAIGAGSAGNSCYSQYFPIFIPKGTLVSGRIQALITVDTAGILMYANGGTSAFPGPLFSGCDAYGTNSAASQGTSHTPGNTGTESTAADIGGTTSRNYGAVMLSQNGTLSNVTMNSLAYHWELRIGGVTICEWYTCLGSNEQIFGPLPPAPFLTSIPVGTQLQVRAECSGTAQAQDVAFYCFW